MSKSLLNIISSSRLPNFIVMKQAYIYGIILEYTKKYVKQNLDIEPDLDCYIKYDKKLQITIKTENQYLSMFFKIQESQYLEYIAKILCSYNIIQSKNQIIMIN